MTELRVVTLAGDPDREAALAAALSARQDVELVLRCVDRVELLGSLRSGVIDAVVSVGAPPWFDRQEAHEAAQAETVVVGVVADAADADRLAQLGAALVPASAGVDEVVSRCRGSEPIALVPSNPLDLNEGRRGRLVAVWGPKGAPGRTRITVELAAELASSEPSTLLIDADPYGGDVLQLLGIVDELASVVWAARLAARNQLNEARLTSDLRRAGPAGPVVLPGLPRPELWADVSDFGWSALLQSARMSFAFTISDVGFCIESHADAFSGRDEGRNRMARVTIRSADLVIAVCRADPVGLKNFVCAYDELRELIDDDSILVVANRIRRGEDKEVADILRRHLGVRLFAAIPDAPGEVHRALLAGTSLREAGLNSSTGEAIGRLASAVGGRVAARGLLARLAGRA